MKRWVFTLFTVLLLLPGLAQAKIFLVDTDDTLRVVTASGVSTIHMYAAWADLTTTALTPGSSSARVTTATTTVLVAAPAASTQRQIKGLTIRNNHASSSNAITVEFFDGTNATELVKYTLLAGETLEWGEDENFKVIDASGQIKGLVAATQSGTWSVTGDTELPSAAALADNTANPTVPGVAAFLMCYDGSTWDRCQGGLTDTDDGTIAAAQVPSISVTIPYEYDGTNWTRPRGQNTVAHDAVDAGNPIKIGAFAETSVSGAASVADGDRTNLKAGIDGVLLVRPHSNLEDRVSGTAGITDGSSTSIVAAQGAGIRFCATTIVISNSSATNVTVDIRDGTAGSVLMTIPAAANMGGGVISLQTPLCTTANTIFAADPSASASTVAVTAVGFKTAL